MVQTVIWGACLGPGVITRNLYAGMWLLPFLILLNNNLFTAIIIGMAIGVAHGSTRALGVLHNRKQMEKNCTHLLILGTQLHWKYIDGLVLLLAAGTLIAYILGSSSHL